MSYTVLQNKEVRLMQYVNAVKWYIEHTSLQIVFVENTGCNISPLFEKEIAQKRLEVFTFNGNDYDKSIGKGYGEAQIIKFALKHSHFLRFECSIIKVTGRMICENICRIEKRCNNINCVYALIRMDTKGVYSCNSQVFVTPRLFLENYFLHNINTLNDSQEYYFEHLLYDAAKQWRLEGHDFCDLWFPIKLKGISGSTGIVVNTGNAKSIVSFYLHYICHRLGYYGPFNNFWKTIIGQ